MAINEGSIIAWAEILDDFRRLAGAAEQTRIVPNLIVIDAAPSGLTGYIIVRSEQGVYIPVLKLPGFAYAVSDYVNVLYMKGTEPVAISQGAASPSTAVKVSDVWESDFGSKVIEIDASGNVTVNSAQADRDVTISWDSGTALSIDGATGNTSIGTILIVNSVIRRVGDSDTNITFTDDKQAFNAGNVEMLALIETAQDEVVVNDGSGDVDFRVESDNLTHALFGQGSDGKIGINTSVIPHGSIGAAHLAMDGTNGSTAGPHIQITTASDDYPLFQVLNWTHDNIALAFDCYYAGGADFVSSDAGSNAIIRKLSDTLSIYRDSGVTAGDTMSSELVSSIDLTTGNVGIGQAPASNTRFKVRDAVGGGPTRVLVESLTTGPVTLIPTADITYDVASFLYCYRTSGGVESGGIATVTTSASFPIVTAVGTWTISFSSGDLIIQRTSGAGTLTAVGFTINHL